MDFPNIKRLAILLTVYKQVVADISPSYDKYSDSV